MATGHSADGDNARTLREIKNVIAAYRQTTQEDHPPVAQSMDVSTEMNTLISIPLQASDDGKPNPPGVLSYIITSLPDHGTLEDPTAGLITDHNTTLVGNGNQVVYVPDTGFNGTDSFQFKVNDGGTAPDGGDSNTATILLNVYKVIYEADMGNPLWRWWT